MDNVKVFALSVCVSLVIGSVLSMIAPNIEKNKIFKVILSVFLLTGLISPLSSIRFDNNISQALENVQVYEENNELNESIIENIENNAAVSLYPIIKSELNYFGISNEFGLILNFKKEKEGIKIESVNISVWDLHSIDKEKLQSQIAEKTGLPINIVEIESEKS